MIPSLQFLGTLESVKQCAGSVIQCIFAAGPFSILSVDGDTVYSFNEVVHAPFFTQQQVVELLAQFAAAKGLELEDGIAADIHRLTAGHAELVCACGRALGRPAKVKQEAGRISLAAWRAYAASQLLHDVMRWTSVASMVENVGTLPVEAHGLLEAAVCQASSTLQLEGRSKAVIKAAAHLATEGWLLPRGGRSATTFAVTSPLLRSVALNTLGQPREAPIRDL